MSKKKVCVWREVRKQMGWYSASCNKCGLMYSRKQVWALKFCPYCGKPIKVKATGGKE